MPAPHGETEEVLEHQVRVAASPETVFAYFVDPARMVQWMGTEATLDPRPGGICRINPGGRDAMLGEFIEIDPPHRVAFTWGWETELLSTPPQSTLVEVALEPDGDGTVVRLAHRRLRPQAVPFHLVGWEHYLRRLAQAAAGEDPGVDPWCDLETATKALSAPYV